jgi:hypothetical protein
MLEGVDVPTLRTLPCPFLGIGVAIMNHLHNEMAVKAHRRFTVNVLDLRRFTHSSPLLLVWFTISNSISYRLCCQINRTRRFCWTEQVRIR